MAREISNHDDMIDSRDVIERIEELRDLAVDAWRDAAGDEGADFPEGMAHNLWLAEHDAEEYDALRDLADEGSREIADWEHGETLIRDSYFVTYAQELAEDIGAIPADAGWPAYCIDWEWAARELRMDYSPVEFDGVTYWGRS